MNKNEMKAIVRTIEELKDKLNKCQSLESKIARLNDAPSIQTGKNYLWDSINLKFNLIQEGYWPYIRNYFSLYSDSQATSKIQGELEKYQGQRASLGSDIVQSFNQNVVAPLSKATNVHANMSAEESSLFMKIQQAEENIERLEQELGYTAGIWGGFLKEVSLLLPFKDQEKKTEIKQARRDLKLLKKTQKDLSKRISQQEELFESFKFDEVDFFKKQQEGNSILNEMDISSFANAHSYINTYGSIDLDSAFLSTKTGNDDLGPDCAGDQMVPPNTMSVPNDFTQKPVISGNKSEENQIHQPDPVKALSEAIDAVLKKVVDNHAPIDKAKQLIQAANENKLIEKLKNNQTNNKDIKSKMECLLAKAAGAFKEEWMNDGNINTYVEILKIINETNTALTIVNFSFKKRP